MLFSSHFLITSIEFNSTQKNMSGYSKKQKCCWECVVYVLTVPGGGGSAPVWRQRSHHVDPWTPHLELHTWALVKDRLDFYICTDIVLLDILATGLNKRHQSPVSQRKLNFAAYISVSCSAGWVNSGFWSWAMSTLKGSRVLDYKPSNTSLPTEPLCNIIWHLGNLVIVTGQKLIPREEKCGVKPNLIAQLVDRWIELFYS